MIVEINFDGLIGPTHNYAGLSPGNLASDGNRGMVAQPRIAALQGLAKMRANLARGLPQGWLMPLPRPDTRWLDRLGMDYRSAPPHIAARAVSASAMWAANAATVSPAPDTRDGRCHLTVANLLTMPHRSHEWPDTMAQLAVAFADEHFRLHAPVPAPFGDEGAANHMRLAPRHDAPGLELFVYGEPGGPFPARQSREASEAVARLHRLHPDRTLFVRQADVAIAAGAFHNDVVAVANGPLLFCHEQAFEDREETHAAIRAAMPDAIIHEVAAADVSLADAVRSYLFNSQLVTMPDGSMALIAPSEVREVAAVSRWIDAHVGGNQPIAAVHVVDVRQSMANGGGPACLRLRVACDPARVDSRFLCDEARLDAAADVVTRWWPETLAPADLAAEGFIERAAQAHARLLDTLGLGDLFER